MLGTQKAIVLCLVGLTLNPYVTIRLVSIPTLVIKEIAVYPDLICMYPDMSNNNTSVPFLELQYGKPIPYDFSKVLESHRIVEQRNNTMRDIKAGFTNQCLNGNSDLIHCISSYLSHYSRHSCPDLDVQQFLIDNINVMRPKLYLCMTDPYDCILQLGPYDLGLQLREKIATDSFVFITDLWFRPIQFDGYNLVAIFYTMYTRVNIFHTISTYSDILIHNLPPI